MQVTTIKTRRISTSECDLFTLLDESISTFATGSILAISAKIVSLCQGRVVRREEMAKDDLIRQEADRWLPFDANPYGIPLTIKDNLLTPMAGIDESNGDGVFILWPQDPQGVANAVRAYLCRRFGLDEVGVLLTDSNVTPMRMGTVGVGLAHSGFLALNDYRGTADLFGRPLGVTTANLLDGLAATAVMLMGEGSEQTPLAVISELPFVTFQTRNPTAEELAQLRINPADDLYGPLWGIDLWEGAS